MTQTPADLHAALTRALADPKVAHAAKAWTDFHATQGVWNPGHGTLGPQADFERAITPHLPAGYHAVIGQDGQPALTKDGLPSWVFPLALVAMGLTAGAATGAFSVPAISSAASSVAPAVAAPTFADPFVTLAATGGSIPGVPVAATGFHLGSALTKAVPSIINAGTQLYGQHVQVKAADRAAQIQADATNRATDATAKANADALTFQQQQAQHQDTVAESTRHANYDQWAAGQHRLQSVGNLLGAGPREIPAYVPLPPSNYGGPSAPGSVGALASPAPPAAPRSGMVTMTAPDGSRNAVPAGQVAYWQQRGAKVAAGSVGDLVGA